MQQIFTVYCYAIVGVVGNFLIGWEVGRKGLRRVSLEGPRNRRITFAIGGFLVMILWERAGVTAPFTNWRNSVWPALIAVGAFFLARALTPRSQRLFDRAKTLHEMTYVGDWSKPRTESELASARDDPQLLEAVTLYSESAAIQTRLAAEVPFDAERDQHRRNVATVHCQLAIVRMMQGLLTEAIEEAVTARRMAEETHDDATLSVALYNLGMAEKLAGDKVNATAHLRLALALEESAGDDGNAGFTRALLLEIAEEP